MASSASLNTNNNNTPKDKASADLDVTYLKEKKIPALLESLAAEFIVHKPHDPESYLRNRFHAGTESSGLEEGGSSDELGVIYLSKLCPLSAIVKMAASRCAVRLGITELESVTTAGGGAGGSPTATSSKLSTQAQSTSLVATNRTTEVASSPFGKTPCIENKGLVVLEVGPVVRYLCHGTPYLPATFRNRVKVEVAFDVIVANVLPNALIAVNEKYVLPRATNRPVDGAAIQQAASRFRSDIVQMLQRNGASSSSFFAESLWVAGREPSIADMALAAGVFALQNIAGYDVITGLSAVEKWWDAVKAEAWYVKGLGDWVSVAAALHSR